MERTAACTGRVSRDRSGMQSTFRGDYLAGGFRWRFGEPGTRVLLSDRFGGLYRIVLADYF